MTIMSTDGLAILYVLGHLQAQWWSSLCPVHLQINCYIKKICKNTEIHYQHIWVTYLCTKPLERLHLCTEWKFHLDTEHSCTQWLLLKISINCAVCNKYTDQYKDHISDFSYDAIVNTLWLCPMCPCPSKITTILSSIKSLVYHYTIILIMTFVACWVWQARPSKFGASLYTCCPMRHQPASGQ